MAPLEGPVAGAGEELSEHPEMTRQENNTMKIHI